MNRGDVYRSTERSRTRGDKLGYYVVVSRSAVAGRASIETVICAPIYSRVLGLSTEVAVGPPEGIPRMSAIRCDFLTLVFKRNLRPWISTLEAGKLRELDRALAYALELTLLPC